MADELKILCPHLLGKEQKTPEIPSSFAVFGSVSAVNSDQNQDKHKIKSIRVSVVLNNGQPMPLEVKARFFNPLKTINDNDPLLHWMAIFSKVNTGDKNISATITARSHGQKGTPVKSASVDVLVKPLDKIGSKSNGKVGDAPLISWPPEDYIISGDELILFYSFGSSDLPLSYVKIDDNSAYFEWTEDTSFWWASFNDLGSDPGPIGLTNLDVKNADQETDLPVSLEQI